MGWVALLYHAWNVTNIYFLSLIIFTDCRLDFITWNKLLTSHCPLPLMKKVTSQCKPTQLNQQLQVSTYNWAQLGVWTNASGFPKYQIWVQIQYPEILGSAWLSVSTSGPIFAILNSIMNISLTDTKYSSGPGKGAQNKENTIFHTKKWLKVSY